MIIKYEEFLLENNTVKPEDFDITKYEWVNGFLDCDQHVEIYDNKLDKIPFKFGKVNGSFNCCLNNLTSLVGCPEIINGSFYCHNNKLTSLEYGPKEIDGNYWCQYNKLTTLEFIPKYIKYDFYCSNNKFSSIEDYPLSIIEGKFLQMYEIDKFLFHFNDIKKLVDENREIFKPLIYDKVGFHQMVMRLNPDLMQYYLTIQPPSKKTIL